jgi:hypothetical protein
MVRLSILGKGQRLGGIWMRRTRKSLAYGRLWAIPPWRACQSLPTGFSGPSFFTEWTEDSERAFGFDLGGKRGSDDGKAVFVGFRDDPPLADGSLGVEPDRHGALRHVLRPYSLRAPGCPLLAPRVTKKNSPQRCAVRFRFEYDLIHRAD